MLSECRSSPFSVPFISERFAEKLTTDKESPPRKTCFSPLVVCYHPQVLKDFHIRPWVQRGGFHALRLCPKVRSRVLAPSGAANRITLQARLDFGRPLQKPNCGGIPFRFLTSGELPSVCPGHFSADPQAKAVASRPVPLMDGVLGDQLRARPRVADGDRDVGSFGAMPKGVFKQVPHQ